jgi:predicted site-specific integrase-resolvase
MLIAGWSLAIIIILVGSWLWRYRVADLRALMHEDAPDVARDTRCLLYARVSTKTPQEAGNLDRQLGRLTAFAVDHQWAVVAA